jgi:hypothetical protein
LSLVGELFRIRNERFAMHRIALLALLFTGGISSPAEIPTPLTAAEIMAKVAVNQDKAQALRKQYVYEQRIVIATRKTNGKLMRRELASYAVTPSDAKTTRKLNSLEGRYWHKGKYIEFQKEEDAERGNVDGVIVSAFREDLGDSNSKDGLDNDLFPLTTDQQKKFRFELAGERIVAGRPAYCINFSPPDGRQYDWAGEAWIDKQDFQPSHVATKLSRRLPILVRTMLGTDVPGLGFNVEYRRFDDGLWFPVSFGTEFRVRAVFLLNRDISVSLENKHFERAKVDSSIQFAESK